MSEGSCCLGGATSFKDKEVLILIQRNLRFSSRLPDINSPTNLESEWKEKLQEQPTAPGTQGKAETGRMEMLDLLLSQGCARAHSRCPELLLKHNQREGRGRGWLRGWHRGSPGSTARLELWCCCRSFEAPPAPGAAPASPACPDLWDPQERQG